jgi:hypothetical protein
MAATGELKSIEDRYHNKLTFGPKGIVSNAGGGLTVPFLRDEQGRITVRAGTQSRSLQMWVCPW